MALLTYQGAQPSTVFSPCVQYVRSETKVYHIALKELYLLEVDYMYCTLIINS
jgi:hypothetical protein